MANHAPRKPHRTQLDEREERNPEQQPVEPDEGQVPAGNPRDPEQDGVADPEA